MTATPPASDILIAKFVSTTLSIADAMNGMSIPNPSKLVDTSVISGLTVSSPGTIATSSYPYAGGRVCIPMGRSISFRHSYADGLIAYHPP